MYMRGRPVVFYAPEKRADTLSYDINKVQPAPAKKLKLDWVKSKLNFIIANEPHFLFLGLWIPWERLPLKPLPTSDR